MSKPEKVWVGNSTGRTHGVVKAHLSPECHILDLAKNVMEKDPSVFPEYEICAYCEGTFNNDREDPETHLSAELHK